MTGGRWDVTEAESTTEQTPNSKTSPTGGPPPWRRGRRIAVLGLVLLLAAIAIAMFVLQRKPPPLGPPGWVTPPGPVPPVAAEIEANVRRLLERESTILAAAAERAGQVPGLAALLTSSLDGAAFQDALSSEPWWKEFRAYGCAVLVGDDVKAVWQLPGTGLPPAALARTVGAISPGARVVSGPDGIVLGAMAPITGTKGVTARVLLVQAIDRRKVALMAARANIVMMLSDGQKDLGASLPDDSVPLVEGLVGRESSHVQVERHLQQLAVAVPWVPGLWLWVVTGWQP